MTEEAEGGELDVDGCIPPLEEDTFPAIQIDSALFSVWVQEDD